MDEIQQLFDRLRSGPFDGKSPHATPQEILKGDPTLFLAGDQIGDDPGDPWLKFIRQGVFNGDFAIGLVDTNFVVSEVASGATTQAYKASQSAELPYWVVSAVAASSGTKVVTDSGAYAGYAINFKATTGTQTNRIYQDIPVVNPFYSSHRPAMRFRHKRIVSGSGTLRFYASWRGPTHALIGSRVEVYAVNLSGGTGSWTGFLARYFDALAAQPEGAAYLRLELEAEHTASSEIRVNPVFIGDGAIMPRHWEAPLAAGESFGELHLGASAIDKVFTYGHVTVDGYDLGRNLIFGSDGATPAKLSRSGPDTLFLADGDTFSAEHHNARGTLRFGNVLSADITADQNDWNPTGFSTASIIRANPTAARNITGIVAALDGRMIWLYNRSTTGANTITLVNNSGSSSAGNRFATPGGASYVIGDRRGACLWYDATSAFWRVMEPA